MVNNFEISELVRIFRSGLLALLPVMDAAHIRWAEPRVYDPWEDIERTLFNSIVGSCIENAVPNSLPSLAPYGVAMMDYSAHSFISERSLHLAGIRNVLIELRIGAEPFDTAVFNELDPNLKPIGSAITKPIEACDFVLARWTAAGITYCGLITYSE